MKQLHKFEFEGGSILFDFINTVDERPYGLAPRGELLDDFEALQEWVSKSGEFSKQLTAELAALERAEKVGLLEELLGIRETLSAIFSELARGKSPDFGAIQQLDTCALQLPPLHLKERRGDYFQERDLVTAREKLLAPIIDAALSILTSPTLKKLKVCASKDCGWVFIDTSKNSSRRWCSMEDCGNRAKARDFYRRSKG